MNEGIDFRDQARQMHRRAQAAESFALKAQRRAQELWHMLEPTLRNNRTAKRKIKRLQGRLRQLRWQDNLTRIIELGRLFP